MSFGDTQGTSPFQYAGFSFVGVAPLVARIALQAKDQGHDVVALGAFVEGVGVELVAEGARGAVLDELEDLVGHLGEGEVDLGVARGDFLGVEAGEG